MYRLRSYRDDAPKRIWSQIKKILEKLKINQKEELLNYGINCRNRWIAKRWKSTLFNAITKAGAEMANYPFATIDPNVGMVEVPDKRLDRIQELIPAKKWFQLHLNSLILPESLRVPARVKDLVTSSWKHSSGWRNCPRCPGIRWWQHHHCIRQSGSIRRYWHN